MRTKKRLRWAREESADGMAVYKAKRKTESAVIVPAPEGGYSIIYRSHKCKRKAVVATIAAAKEAAETMRASSMQRNPLMPSRPTKLVLIGAGVGILGTAAVVWWMNRNAATTASAQLPPAGGTTNSSNTQIYVTLKQGAQTTSYNGGMLFVDLPTGAQSWTSVGTDTSVAGSTASIQLPANPVGSYTFGYVDGSSQHQTATLTVTGPSTTPGA